MPIPALADAGRMAELLLLALMWLLAKAGGELCHRLKLPRVLGELGAGFVLAALLKVFPGVVPDPASQPAMAAFAEVGIVVLVFVSALATDSGRGGPLPWGELAKTLGLAVGFLALAVTAGRVATPRLFQLANRLRSEQVLLPLGLGFAFLFAWLGSRAGLATIVGAYAAGLLMEPAHIKHLEDRELKSLEDLLHPLVVRLSPLFFVLMGASVDPRALLPPWTLLFVGVLALLGVLGKYLAGYGAGRGLRPSVIG